MASAARFLGQAVLYGLVAVFLGYFSADPPYVHFPPDQAMIRLSFAHGAERRGECRQLTAEELQRLAPNMRVPTVCPRERLPVFVELELDGELLYRAELPPTGLNSDGPSRAYESFAVQPGRHTLAVRLRDTARTDGFDYDRVAEVELAPRQHLVIDFRADIGGFVFR